MRNAHVRYMCYPSVVCTGVETEVWVKPRDVSRIFRNEWEYELGVVGLLDDQHDYHAHVPLDTPFEVKEGCLVFRYTFEKEQEYSIRFCKKGDKEIKISLYAVAPDLYELRPLKGDLHTHTYYSDGQDGISMTPADYREEGYDFFALTDHNRMYTSVLANELYDGVKLGMHIMLGEEVHTPGSLTHIVHVGGSESVCDKYIRDPEGYEKAVDEIEKTLTHVDPVYRRRIAMAKWACEEIKRVGGLSIFAHPYWCPNRYNVSSEFIDYLYDNKMFDAFEVMGGIHYAKINMQLALWQDKALQGNYLPPIGSTDSHNHDSDIGFARRFTVVFAKENTTEAILDAIRKGYTVAADCATKDINEARFYGSMRLVMFAHFLFDNYFNETWRLCVGEGILMRRYAEGEEVGEVLSSLADTVENFYKKFYGITKPEGLTKRTVDFLDKARKAQLESNLPTNGSTVYFYGRNKARE